MNADQSRWTPQPRAPGMSYISAEMKAAIDLSDGLSTDLLHVCEASGVCAELDGPTIPLHALAGERLELGLHGGEDYELLFTAPAEARMPRRLGGVAVTMSPPGPASTK